MGISSAMSSIMSLLNGAEVCCVAMVSLVASLGCGAGWDLRKKTEHTATLLRMGVHVMGVR